MAEDFIKELKSKGYSKIYLSHNPWEEKQARNFANKLRKEGLKVIVAADARPHKDNPRDEKDLEIVRQVIDSCDAVIVYKQRKP